MPDGRRLVLQMRIGAFILIGLVVFLAIIYLLGAQARYFERKSRRSSFRPSPGARCR